MTLSAQRVPRCLQLAAPLSCCLEHRQSFDKGAAATGTQGFARAALLRRAHGLRPEVLAGQSLLRAARRMGSACAPTASGYAERWGMLVELEAAASAVESNDSRPLAVWPS